MSGVSVPDTRHALLRAALDVLHQERCLDAPQANPVALRMAEERLALAARDHVSAVDELPPDKRPKTWSLTPDGRTA